MKLFELSDALIDAYYTDTANEISTIHDEIKYGSWYMEGCEYKKSIVQRLKDQVTRFFSKIRTAWIKLFSSKTVQDAMDVTDSSNGTGEGSSNTTIELEKQKVAENICKEGDQTIQNLDKCKTSEEVEKEMTRYRKKIKAFKIGAVVTAISLAAGGAYLHHKKNEMLNTWKKQETARLKEIDKLNDKLAAERTLRAQENAIARSEKELAAAEKLEMQNKIKRLESQNKIAQKQGAAEGRTAVLKAKLEVTADQSRATTEAIGEITQKLADAKGLSEKLTVIKNEVSDIPKTNDKIAREGIRSVKMDAKDVYTKGRELREKVDRAIKILESDTSADRKRNALNWLIKAEPTFSKLGGKYATMRHDITSWENKLNMAAVRKTKSIPK